MSRGSPTFTDTSRGVTLPGVITVSRGRTESVHGQIQSSSFLFGEYLRVGLSVRVEIRLLVICPCCSLVRAADVPVGTAALEHGTQVEAQFFDCWPTEEPIAVVDLVDAEPWLEHHGVRDHRVVIRVRVLRDVEIFL